MPEGRVIVARLARLRVPLGFACGALVFWLAKPTPPMLGAGIAVAAGGEAIRLWAAGHLHKSVEVTSSGPYRWFAHPLYIGSTVIGIGVAIACSSWYVSGIIAAYLAITLTAAVKNEARFLRETFGSRYDEYVTNGVVDADRRFSVRRALANREHRAVIGLTLGLLLLVLKERIM